MSRYQKYQFWNVHYTSHLSAEKLNYLLFFEWFHCPTEKNNLKASCEIDFCFKLKSYTWKSHCPPLSIACTKPFQVRHRWERDQLLSRTPPSAVLPKPHSFCWYPQVKPISRCSILHALLLSQFLRSRSYFLKLYPNARFLLYFPCSLTLENASSRTGLRFSFHVVPSQSGLL